MRLLVWSCLQICLLYQANLESIFGDVEFPALKVLSVVDCQSLKSFRLDGKKFPELETLAIHSCGNLDLELWKVNHLEEQSHKLKLKTVVFSNLSQLVTLPKWLQQGGNSLQGLIIIDCDNIQTLPDWLTTMSDLKTLMIDGCHDLCEKYQPHVGEFWPKISHIKNIYIDEPEVSEELGEEQDEEECIKETDKP